MEFDYLLQSPALTSTNHVTRATYWYIYLEEIVLRILSRCCEDLMKYLLILKNFSEN